VEIPEMPKETTYVRVERSRVDQTRKQLKPLWGEPIAIYNGIAMENGIYVGLVYEPK